MPIMWTCTESWLWMMEMLPTNGTGFMLLGWPPECCTREGLKRALDSRFLAWRPVWCAMACAPLYVVYPSATLFSKNWVTNRPKFSHQWPLLNFKSKIHQSKNLSLTIASLGLFLNTPGAGKWSTLAKSLSEEKFNPGPAVVTTC